MFIAPMIGLAPALTGYLLHSMHLSMAAKVLLELMDTEQAPSKLLD